MVQPIRVLCVFSCLEPGGSETMCMNLYRKMDRSKIQFDFIKHTHNIGKYEKEIISLGGRIFEAPRIHLTNHYRYIRWWRNFLSEHTEYNVIHVHYFTITLAIAPIAHRYNRVVIGHCHASLKGKGIKSALQRFFIRIGGLNVDYALACSKQAAKAMYGKKECFIMNNAIDVNEFQFSIDTRKKIRDEFSLHDEIVIGHIGRFMPVKNHRFILDIFSSIKKKHNKFILMLVGDGSLKVDIENYARELGVFDDIIFTGVRSDVNELLQAMDCFIFPSLYEGLGIALIEAQASGLPCVISDRIPQEAIVTDGLVSILKLEQSPDMWANCIINNVGKHRLSRVDEVKNHGYDIDETSKWAQSFYFDILKSMGRL